MQKQINLLTPIKMKTSTRFQRTKKFSRKPGQRSQPSLTKKSISSPLDSIYMKCSSSINGDNSSNQDFYSKLFSQVMTSPPKNIKKRYTFKQGLTQRKYDNPEQEFECQPKCGYQLSASKKQLKIKTLEAEIQLKNFQLGTVSGEVLRLKNSIEEERERRKKIQIQKKLVGTQLKQTIKSLEGTQIQLHKLTKQKQHLLKQIQFLQRINYDQKTLSMQSYRQHYLQNQLLKIRKEIQKCRSQREEDLQKQLKIIQEQRFSIQAHYKAIKVANQCLIKQIKNMQDNVHNIVVNSEEYKKLRDKYGRFLEEYKMLRNQFWALKAEINNPVANGSDLFFSLSASQVEKDLTLHKSPQTAQLIPTHHIFQFHQLLSNNFGQSETILLEEIKQQYLFPVCFHEEQGKDRCE